MHTDDSLASTRGGLTSATLLFVLAPFLSSCAATPSPTVLLLELHSAQGLASVRVTAAPQRGVGAMRAWPVNLDGDALEASHVVVQLELPHAGPYVVTLVGEAYDRTTPLVAVRCYDVQGQLEDDVLLTRALPGDDTDGDGSPRDAGGACLDAGDAPCDVGRCPSGVGDDCDDLDPDRYPGAPTLCENGIDEDCRQDGLPDGDEPCGDTDADGVDACGPARGVCDCNDEDASVHPGAVDFCGNGIDEDCSGEPGAMGALCDADVDGYPSDVDCDDSDPSIHPGELTLEHCTAVGGTCECDGLDNNCNGLVDEDGSCVGHDLDGDGSAACTPGSTDCGGCDCNDCDSGIHPGATEYCGDGIDEDGVGGDRPCAPGDTDRDGYTGVRDCAEDDPRVYLDAAENCSTSISESCGVASCDPSGDADSDGFAGETDCDDTNPSVSPWATEACNGTDDNCNGAIDEVLDPTNHLGCATDPTCAAASRCEVFFDENLHHCGACGHECNPGTTLVADHCLRGVCSCGTSAPCASPLTCVAGACTMPS